VQTVTLGRQKTARLSPLFQQRDMNIDKPQVKAQTFF
jgi:hypothetical protein